MYNPEIFEVHRPLFRRMAGESMVLLKNDNGNLPFAEGTKIAIFGKNQIQFIKGGRGRGSRGDRFHTPLRFGGRNYCHQPFKKGTKARSSL